MRRVVSRAVALLGACHPGPAFAVTLLAGLLAARWASARAASPWSSRRCSPASSRSAGPTTSSTWLATARSGGRTSRWWTAGSPSGPSASPAALAVARDRPAVAGLRMAGRRSPPGLRRRRLGLQPRRQGHAVVVAAVRRRVRWPAGVRLPDRRPGPGAPAVAACWPARCSAWVRTSSTSLPDLADDAATGVRGLPHRLGARWSQVVAAAVLVAAAVVIVVGAPIDSTVVAVVALVVTAGAGRGGAARARPGAVPGRDRHGAGGRGHAGAGRDDIDGPGTS